MLISHRHRFVFVHVPKTGGDTVREVLREHVDFDSAAHPEEGAGRSKHWALSTIRRVHPETVDYMSFGFVRNPWDQLVSAYSYCHSSWHPLRDEVIALGSFAAFVPWLVDRVGDPLQSRLLFADDVQIVTTVGRYEQLETDVRSILDQLGLDPPASFPAINRSIRDPYRAYYDRPLREWVGQRYAKDIELFGYRF